MLLKIVYIFPLIFVVNSANSPPKYLQFGGNRCGQIDKKPVNSTSGDILGSDFVERTNIVTEGEMPWMARLNVSHVDGSFEICDGFIIDEKWIVTVAHCLTRVVTVRVSVGRVSYQPGSSGQHEQFMIVPTTRIFLHPFYDQVANAYDIGLIQMPNPFQFNQFVQPICILDESSCQSDETSFETFDFCLVNSTSTAGWTFDLPNVTFSVGSLKRVDLQILQQCQPRQQQQQICVQEQHHQGTHLGSFGGPIFCVQNDTAVAIGMVSLYQQNIGNCQPQIHNRICPYSSWIRKIVENSTNGCRVPSKSSGNVVVDVFTGIPVPGGKVMPMGSVIALSCDLGFIAPVSEQQSICTVMKTWMPPLVECHRMAPTTLPDLFQCPDPPPISNGQVSSGTNNNVGSQRMVICDDGFENSGHSSFFIYCSPSLQWSQVGNCEKICPFLPIVPNGNILNGSNTVNSTRELSCHNGFDLLAAKSITCLKNGQWSTPGICSNGLIIFINFVNNNNFPIQFIAMIHLQLKMVA